MMEFIFGVFMFLAVRLQESSSGNFPLENCSTAQLDILALYSYLPYPYHWTEIELWENLVKHIVSSPASNNATQRVRFANIYVRSGANNSNNFSSWALTSFQQKSPEEIATPFQQEPPERIAPDEGNRYSLDLTNKSLSTILSEKIQLLERLFSEMGGVRASAIQVGIIYLDREDLSREEVKGIPKIIFQEKTNVKIFVLLPASPFIEDTVTLTDTLVVRNNWDTALMLAVCKHCQLGWTSFSNRDGSLSCYRLIDEPKEIDWHYASVAVCLLDQSVLASVESEEELTFLREYLRSYIERIGAPTNNGSTFDFFVGLRRNLESVAKRFHWSAEKRTVSRPLVVNNWLPGKPSGGRISNCAVWRFEWRSGTSGKHDPDYKGHFVDGWTDVGCFTKITRFSLCEMSVPRLMEDDNFMRLKPAGSDSFAKALAKGGFVKYGDNIVSVSHNIENQEFRDHLESLGESFPLFDCGERTGHPRYISYMFVCDGVSQCGDMWDETACELSPLINQYTQTRGTLEVNIFSSCSGVRCCDDSCLPIQWINDGEVDCHVCLTSTEKTITDESEILNESLLENRNCALICDLGETCVSFSQLNDKRQDCHHPYLGFDEKMGKLEAGGTCYNILGHKIWAPLCVFVKDEYGAVIGCRDMSHLKDCSGFECPEGYVKCPNTYCIPQHYVLDGQADCPKGEDEQRDNIEPCTGNFACWDSQECLHPDLVCDGHPDCPHQDDELDCHSVCYAGFACTFGRVNSLAHSVCYAGFTCKSGTVSSLVQHTKLEDFDGFPSNTRHINISGTYLSKLNIISGNIPNTRILILSNCRIFNSFNIYGELKFIQKIDVSHNLLNSFPINKDDTKSLQNLRHLNLSYNTNFSDTANFQFKFLVTLDLSHTAMTYISKSLLLELPSLEHLNLSFTSVARFQKIFPSERVLLTLDVRGLFVENFHEDFFGGVVVREDLFTDVFLLCCEQIRGKQIPPHVCHAPVVAISSCLDLIEANVQRVLLWVVAVLAVLGNIMVIVYRVIWDRSVLKTGYGLFVTNLGISDFIMGAYLFIISGADYYYRDVYFMYDKTWREGGLCKFAGFLATLSSESSTFFIFLITLDRFFVMRFPFGQIRFSTLSRVIATVLSWFVGFLLALTPIVFKFEIFSSNAMCLGLPLTDNRLTGWEFSFGVFIVFNFLMFLVLAVGQRGIFRAMSESRITGSATSTSPRRAVDIMVAKQLSLVALSNFLCWFPVGIMGFLSLTGHEISNDVYAWTTIIVLPINSAANPLLYTIPFLLDKWDKFKHDGC